MPLIDPNSLKNLTKVSPPLVDCKLTNRARLKAERTSGNLARIAIDGVSASRATSMARLLVVFDVLSDAEIEACAGLIETLGALRKTRRR